MSGSDGEHSGRDGGRGVPEQAAPKRHRASRGSTRRGHARRYQHRIFQPTRLRLDNEIMHPCAPWGAEGRIIHLEM